MSNKFIFTYNVFAPYIRNIQIDANPKYFFFFFVHDTFPLRGKKHPKHLMHHKIFSLCMMYSLSIKKTSNTLD